MKKKYSIYENYSVFINPSFEYGFDLIVVDIYNNKVIINSTVDINYLDELFDYIKKEIKIYENNK